MEFFLYDLISAVFYSVIPRLPFKVAAGISSGGQT